MFTQYHLYFADDELILLFRFSSKYIYSTLDKNYPNFKFYVFFMSSSDNNTCRYYELVDE